MTPGAALITGAGQRLGRAIAMDLASHGWRIAIHYNRSSAAARETAEEIRAAGGRAETVGADLLDESQVEALIARAAEAVGGPLTVLVNNASIFEPDTVSDATRESWDRAIGSNLRAPVKLTQDFAAQAPEVEIDENGEPRAAACVVNMIDQRVWRPTPFFMSYTIAKMGLWAFTRTAAMALAPRVRVNGIGPGPTMVNERQADEHFAKQRQNVILERGAHPSDICAGVRFLISADSMTGQMIALDGGQHLAWKTPDIAGIPE